VLLACMFPKMCVLKDCMEAAVQHISGTDRRESTETEMTIFVRLLQGRSLPLKVDSNDTIKSIKQRLEDVERMAWQRQHLVFGARYMRDWDTLSECNISAYSTLVLLPRFHGLDSFPNMG